MVTLSTRASTRADLIGDALLAVGFLDRVLARSPERAPPETRKLDACVVHAGGLLGIVGESFRQDELRVLAGQASDAAAFREAEPKPSVDESRLGGWHQDVMASSPVLHPVRGRSRVEIPRVLRLLDSVSGQLHPDVGAPERGVARCRDQVPDEATVTQRNGSGAVGCAPGLLELLARCGGILEALRQEHLDLSLTGVTGGEEPAGLVQMLFRKGEHFEVGHAT